MELIPAGPYVVGRDGRAWLFDAAAHQSVQSSYTARAIELPIDWEHATQRRAPQGEEAPAGAWIKQLEDRNGALWGQVAWTPRGERQVESKEYRFLSPVFDYDVETKRIVRLVSAALTNIPNFVMTALNQEQMENAPVKPSPELLKLLNLPETATAEEVFAATTVKLNATSQALNTESGNLDRFVPRADYNALESRALNAESALTERNKADHTKEVDAVITLATQAGKITPATVDYHRAMCQDEAGLTRFKAFVDAAPIVADTTNLGDRSAKTTATALNTEEQAMCMQMGVDPAEYVKTKQSEG